MTRDEFKQLCEIMVTADDRCSICARRLIKKLVEMEPDYKEIAEEIYLKEYDDKIYLAR